MKCKHCGRDSGAFPYCGSDNLGCINERRNGVPPHPAAEPCKTCGWKHDGLIYDEATKQIIPCPKCAKEEKK
jgi:hypothetical protein